MNVSPSNWVILVVRCASSKLEMRCVVRYICVMIGTAIHKGSAAVVARHLGFIAKSAITVEHPHGILRQWTIFVTTRC